MAQDKSPQLIQVSRHYTATLQEIKQVWKLISKTPTITTTRIAGVMGTSRTRVYHIVEFLKRSGYISNAGKRRAWDVRLPYVEV